MEREIKEGQVYEHFKGHVYKIVCVGYSASDLSLQVVYQDINNDKIWIRDYNEFLSKVDKKKYPDVKQEYRFELIEN